MATYSNYALRVPASLMVDVRDASERDGVSINQFIIQSVAEKIAILRDRGMLQALSPEEQAAFFGGRLGKAGPDRFEEVLRTAGTTNDVLPGDELPENWAPSQEAASPGMGR